MQPLLRSHIHIYMNLYMDVDAKLLLWVGSTREELRAMLRSDERAWLVFGEHATRSEDDERANSAILRQCVQGSWIPAKGGCAPLDSDKPDDSTGADSKDAETYAGAGG